MGVLGAVISGTNAMAKNAERLRVGSTTEADAALDVGKEALKNGVVTAATFAAVATLGGELVVSVGLTLIIGTAFKYAWDRGYDAADMKLKVKNNSAKRRRLATATPLIRDASSV